MDGGMDGGMDGRMDGHGRSWTLVGRWVDAGWTLGGRDQEKRERKVDGMVGVSLV